MKNIYLGLLAGSNGSPNTRKVFRSAVTPTFASHGKEFGAVVGPFRTLRAAEFLRDCPSNPHCRCVADAERIVRQHSKHA